MLVSRRSPRELVLTRDGKQILELFRGQHPVLDIVIHTIKVSSAGSALVLCSAPSVPQPVFTITEKAPTSAFYWLKAPTTAFTFKTLC